MNVASMVCDVLVYGSTPGGIAAALEAARRGLRVVLACPKQHLGGMAASGLCTTDAVRRHLFGAMVGEFVARVRAHYLSTYGADSRQFAMCQDGWFYEPSVAERCFQDLVEAESTNLTWCKGVFLTRATVSAGAITAVSFVDAAGTGLQVEPQICVDGTYEGDLAAAAGVPCRVGRESREEFGEPLAGIHFMDWKTGREIVTAASGDASPAIQSFCARSILTSDPAHRVPIARPDSYDQHLPDYLPLLDDFSSGRVQRLHGIMGGCPMPNGKLEINGNIEALTSLNCPGISWEYPEAGYRQRAQLDRFHVEHAAGLLWFLQNDPHVPAVIADDIRRYGLHDQEFTANCHWPWQIYVRQGRRIHGRATVTQHHFTADPRTGLTSRVADAVALGEHSFDVHPCHDRRHAHDGFAEGVLWYPAKARGPAQPGQIPYGALLPERIDNLIVPVALSCTHVAMSVLRMEPVWMTTGQIAGAAAAFALEQHCAPGSLDPHAIARALQIRNVPEVVAAR